MARELDHMLVAPGARGSEWIEGVAEDLTRRLMFDPGLLQNFVRHATSLAMGQLEADDDETWQDLDAHICNEITGGLDEDGIDVEGPCAEDMVGALVSQANALEAARKEVHTLLETVLPYDQIDGDIVKGTKALLGLVDGSTARGLAEDLAKANQTIALALEVLGAKPNGGSQRAAGDAVLGPVRPPGGS
jgi:hypothetical protein